MLSLTLHQDGAIRITTRDGVLVVRIAEPSSANGFSQPKRVALCFDGPKEVFDIQRKRKADHPRKEVDAA